MFPNVLKALVEHIVPVLVISALCEQSSDEAKMNSWLGRLLLAEIKVLSQVIGPVFPI